MKKVLFTNCSFSQTEALKYKLLTKVVFDIYYEEQASTGDKDKL